MRPQDFAGLSPGDRVRGKFSGEAYTIAAAQGVGMIAVRTVSLTNPDEWELVSKECAGHAQVPA